MGSDSTENAMDQLSRAIQYGAQAAQIGTEGVLPSFLDKPPPLWDLWVQLAIDTVILGVFLFVAIVSGGVLAWSLLGFLVVVALWGLA